MVSVDSAGEMPDRFGLSAARYDAMIRWEQRLAVETPFYRWFFSEGRVRRVLDAACGTGRHAVMFHRWGMEVEGADASGEMIDFCRRTHGEPPGLGWVVRPFEVPPQPPGRFDAFVCVGNSLSLSEPSQSLTAAVSGMVQGLRPGGLGLIQVLNLWSVPEGPTQWQKIVRVTLGGTDRIVLKALHRIGDRAWIDVLDLDDEHRESPTDVFESAGFRGLRLDELTDACCRAGAEILGVFGDYARSPYRPETSPDLIVTLRRE